MKISNGDRFGSWTIKDANWSTWANGRQAMCLCDCGTERPVFRPSLTSGLSKSCGCIQRTHGEASVKGATYRAWCCMRDRCLSPSNASFHNYGGRGIKVCARWDDFRNFLADMGRAPAGRSLDRIDVNGDYEPGNCRWATAVEQIRNRRNSIYMTHDGRTQHICDWSAELGVSYNVLWRGKQAGKSIERILMGRAA